MSGGRLVCRVCGRKLSESDAVPVYKKVLDRETGEFKLVVDYYVCRSCDAAMRMRAKGV
jgi:ribosomal protein L40E